MNEEHVDAWLASPDLPQAHSRTAAHGEGPAHSSHHFSEQKEAQTPTSQGRVLSPASSLGVSYVPSHADGSLSQCSHLVILIVTILQMEDRGLRVT